MWKKNDTTALIGVRAYTIDSGIYSVEILAIIALCHPSSISTFDESFAMLLISLINIFLSCQIESSTHIPIIIVDVEWNG